jgi:hypothetical protein
MSEKSPPTNLEAALANLEKSWREVAELLREPRQIESRVMEVEKLILVDSDGITRGTVGINANGSVSLVLSDRTGKPRAWLGLTEEGSGYLSLKDSSGGISCEMPGSPPRPSAPKGVLPGEDPGAQGAGEGKLPEPAPVNLKPGTEAGEPGDQEAGVEGARPTTATEAILDAFNQALLKRLEKIERHNRKVNIVGGALLTLLLLAVGGLGWLFNQIPWQTGSLTANSLVIKDQHGVRRIWLGEQEGKVSLELFDKAGKLRAGLVLGPEGEPRLTLDKQDRKAAPEPAPGPSSGPVTPPQEAQPPKPATGDTTKAQDPEAAVQFVGARNSNKYHYPHCKWAKKIGPAGLITFKSVEEAQEAGYIPCQACQPPQK